ncbi:MAG TPA: cbb3-type cytochrome oxidase assembly protein [Pirellulaceae bacterium]|nr:cbb3-type cytochrome oxidase assembly protein [Planctomycetales bacterium]HRX81023.1 cbb3-type cytochrome oxidase assembly protein [Pirellulaceae bacterium]
MKDQPKASRTKTIVLIVMSVCILVPSMTGFVMKFMEFIHTFQGETDGAFAITPMLNYLLASLGFFCLLAWATMNGMFHDIERPKYRMLEIEEELNKQSSRV